MSRLWRDQIQLFFAPERIDMVRTSRGLKSVPAPKITALCDRSPDRFLWEPPMNQLAQMLQDAAGAELMVTLSNHFVRYITLPPQAEISTPDELYAYAIFRMRDIYAERVDDWALSISSWSPTGGAICAAIDRNLLTQFEDLTGRFGIKLKGIEPYLASVFDRWHKHLDDDRSCLALVETGRFCIALFAGGAWQSIRNQKVLNRVADELLVAINQEAILTGHKEANTIEPVYLFAPEHSGLVLPDDNNWQVMPLQTEQISVPPHFPSPLVDRSEMRECVA